MKTMVTPPLQIKRAQMPIIKTQAQQWAFIICCDRHATSFFVLGGGLQSFSKAKQVKLARKFNRSLDRTIKLIGLLTRVTHRG